METPSPRLLLGTAEPAAPVLALRAGPLQVRLQGTRLLALHAGGHEVWHGAWFLYRDTGWGTPEPVVDRLEQLVDLLRADFGFAAMVPLGKTILFSKWRARRDFSRAPVTEQAWLIHELAHVWQARRGVVLAIAKIVLVRMAKNEGSK